MSRATKDDVLRFARAVWPQAPELALASFYEKKALNDAADRIIDLEAALLTIANHCHEVRGGAPPHVWIPAFVRQSSTLKISQQQPKRCRSLTMTTVNSTSDERTVNNVMRHAYRVLSDAEKEQMKIIKDTGLAFHNYLDDVGTSREMSLAKTKIEEAVMWAVKHITR